MSTVTQPGSMNEANERDPFNNNSYGTLVDAPYKDVKLPILDVHGFQRPDHPRLRGRDGRMRPARRSDGRPFARSRGDRDAPRFQLHRSGYPGVYAEQLHGLHGLRDALPRYGDPGQGAQRERFREAAGGDLRSGRPRDVPQAMVEDPQVLRRPGEEGGRRRDVQDHHRPQQVQGLRGVRHGLRRQCPGDDSQDRAGDDRRPQEPSVLQAVRPVRQAVRQRQSAHRHDAQGADAHLYRRGGKLRRLRRRDRPANDVRRDRRQIRRSMGHHRGHRLQHGLYLDVSLQPVPRAVDQLAV